MPCACSALSEVVEKKLVLFPITQLLNSIYVSNESRKLLLFQNIYVSCRIFGHVTSETCSDSSEKKFQETKGFLLPINPKITLAKEREKKIESKKKERIKTSLKEEVHFDSNIFKNPAR